MKNKKLSAALTALAICLSLLAGCGSDESQISSPAEVQQAQFSDTEAPSQTGAVNISLSGTTAQSSGEGCEISDGEVKITSAGTYYLSGSFNGQIIVKAKGEEVRLVLSGVDITCTHSAPIYIKKADKVIITLAEGTVNSLTDGTSYVYDDEDEQEPDAALFSKADLILEGSGALSINASFNNGIRSNDTLEIHGGKYAITAANHGISGDDCVAIKDGQFNITAGGDAVRATGGSDETAGWISVSNGSFTIDAGQDGLQAESTMYIGGGSFDIVTGGGSKNSSQESSDWGNWQQGDNMPPNGGGNPPGGWGGGRSSGSSYDGLDVGDMWFIDEDESSSSSAKAVKAGSDMLIEGGKFIIDSSDDALHSNGNIILDGAEASINSGDDGIHADSVLSINSGVISITKSYEGIEGTSVNISGGNINITASDDGINSAGGNDGSSLYDRPGANSFASDDNCNITISGGTLSINASGDGIDSNGNLYVSGGVTMVNGPTNSGNGALDYAGSFDISGGTFVAVGSSGMAQGASSSSTQASLMFGFRSAQAGGTLVGLLDENGGLIAAFAPQKTFSSVFVSTDKMQVGDICTIIVGGSCDALADGSVCTQGTVSGYTEAGQFELTQINTGSGSGMGGMGGMGHGGGFGRY